MSDVQKTDEEWKQILPPDVYRITRQKGTEPAFTGVYWDTTQSGVYRCACCDGELFSSVSKFDAGCGWPSFTQAMNESVIDELLDKSFGMRRTEVVCHQCRAHLGHVFDDGPAPNGLRYCINSASLKLEPVAKAE